MGFGFGDLNPTKWSIGGHNVVGGLENIVSAPGEILAGKTPFSGPGSFSKMRDSLETGAVLGANYLLPGSSLLTSGIASKGSQAQLGSAGGVLAQLGTGLAGVGVGSDFTGIPQSAGGAWESGLFGGGSSGGAAGGGADTATKAAFGPDATTAAGTGGGVGAGTVTAPEVAGAGAGSGMTTGQKIALGLAGLNMLGQKPSQPDPRLMNPATTLQGQSQQLIAQGMAGQLNPGDQARLAQSRQADIAKANDYYAKAGLADSSMAQSAISDINARYDQAAYGITQAMIAQGIQAAGIANSQVAAAVQNQIASDQAAQQAQATFMAALMQYGLKGA